MEFLMGVFQFDVPLLTKLVTGNELHSRQVEVEDNYPEW